MDRVTTQNTYSADRYNNWHQIFVTFFCLTHGFSPLLNWVSHGADPLRCWDQQLSAFGSRRKGVSPEDSQQLRSIAKLAALPRSDARLFLPPSMMCSLRDISVFKITG